MLFYGVSGSGKKSLVFAFINSLLITHYNIDITDIKISSKDVNVRQIKNMKYSNIQRQSIII